MINKHPLSYEQALNYTLRLLNQRGYTEATLRQKLTQKKVSPQDIHKVITKLYDLSLINDANYAKSLIRTESLYRHSSTRYITQKLYQKGVPSTLVAPAIQQVANDTPSERERATYHAQKYWKKYAALPANQTRQKIARHLYSKGFSVSIINQAIKDIRPEPPSESE
jgi:regulatory protein